jgi:ankyrin repeat protein
VRLNRPSAAGATVAAASASGDTPLHSAARGGHVRACAALVALGADLAAVARDGATPLDRWCAMCLLLCSNPLRKRRC